MNCIDKSRGGEGGGAVHQLREREREIHISVNVQLCMSGHLHFHMQINEMFEHKAILHSLQWGRGIINWCE